MTDTLCVTTSCSSAAMRARSAARARSVAAAASAPARRSRAVESASRRRSSRMPRPAAAAGRTTKIAVSRPGNWNWGKRVAELRGGGDGGQGHRGDRQVPVPGVGDRAVGGVHGGTECDLRHEVLLHDRDRGDDDQPGRDRVQPPPRQRQRGERGGGQHQQRRVRRDQGEQLACLSSLSGRPACTGVLDGGRGADHGDRRGARPCLGALRHLVDRADRRTDRDGAVQRERPACRRRAARFGPPEEGDKRADTSCHVIIVAGMRGGGILRPRYARLHRKDDGRRASQPGTLRKIHSASDADGAAA